MLLWAPFAGLMMASAVALMIAHLRSWRTQQAAGLAPAELEFRRRQFRRRMQTSGMLAVIAASLPLGLWILARWPKVGVYFWGGVLVMVLWLAALALADIWATKLYYGKIRYDYRVEQARLEAELRRVQSAQGNGKPSRSFPSIRGKTNGEQSP